MSRQKTYLFNSIKVEAATPAPEIEVDFVVGQAGAPINFHYKTGFGFGDGVERKILNFSFPGQCDFRDHVVRIAAIRSS